MRLLATIDNIVDRLDRPLFMGNPFSRPYYHIFPTLSRKPLLDGSFEHNLSENPTISNTFESGDVKTRPRFTTIKKSFIVGYQLMTDADKVLIQNFLLLVSIGAASFRWTNPQDDTIYTVRFSDNVSFRLTTGRENLWAFTLRMVEA